MWLFQCQGTIIRCEALYSNQGKMPSNVLCHIIAFNRLDLKLVIACDRFPLAVT